MPSSLIGVGVGVCQQTLDHPQMSSAPILSSSPGGRNVHRPHRWGSVRYFLPGKPVAALELGLRCLNFGLLWGIVAPWLSRSDQDRQNGPKDGITQSTGPYWEAKASPPQPRTLMGSLRVDSIIQRVFMGSL